MTQTTIGKYRHMMHSSSADGVFNIIAIDHRDNLRTRLDQHSKSPTNDSDFTIFKQTIIGALLPSSTALLTDPAFGIAAGVQSHMIGGNKGLLAPVEVTDYDLHPSERDMQMIPGWSVAKIKRIGGDGVKLLLPFNPNAKNDEKLARVQSIINDCARYELPFYLEPIAYSLDPAKTLSNDELLAVMVDMAARFSKMGVDVLKLQFPVDATQSRDESTWHEACAAVDAACDVPWVLLSAGVDFDTFAQQAQMACQHGASGVIVGRAVWQEAIALHKDARGEFLATTAKERMQTLMDICTQYARSWYERVTLPNFAPDWYERYDEGRGS